MYGSSTYISSSEGAYIRYATNIVTHILSSEGGVGVNQQLHCKVSNPSTGYLDVMEVFMNHLQDGTQVHGLVTQTVASSDLRLLHSQDVSIGHVSDIRDVKAEVDEY